MDWRRPKVRWENSVHRYLPPREFSASKMAPLSPTLSNPYPACAILRCMSHPPDFIHHGLEQARLALWAVINMTNAHLRPLTLKRSLKQRASGRLKQLEIIVRRLLTLMALALTKRLARSLERQRKRGDPKPQALPMASAYRLRPELGMIATALPGLLSAALETWDNSS